MRFYFDIHEGDEIIPDEEGLELATVEDAYTEASRSLAGLAKDVIASHRGTGHQLAIEVRDHDGPVLAVRLSFEARRHKQ